MIEAGLLRPVGGWEVHRDQLSHVLEMASQHSVQFQVVPTAVGEHMAMGAPFSVFGFSDGDGVAAADHVTGTLYLEDREQVERYKVAFQHLCGTALNQRDSLNLVRDYVGKERSAWSNTG